MQKAQELKAAGKPVESTLLRLFTFMRAGYTVAQMFDRLQNVPAVEQWMRQQVVEGLRAQGLNRAEADQKADWVMGDIKAELQLALAEARATLPALGITDENEIKAGALRLVRAKQYERMRGLQLPADDFESRNQDRAETIAWNEKEQGGIGGLVAENLRRIGAAATRGVAEHPTLAPLVAPVIALTRFSNAIGILINRKLTWAGLGFFPGAFGVHDYNIDANGVAHGQVSPWYRYPEQRRERKVEGAFGLSFIILGALLTGAGIIIVRQKWPKDKEERQLWDRMGWRPGQVDIPVDDGKHITFSLNTGPMVPIAPGLAAGGALHDLFADREKQQAKLNAEAEKKGIEPGKIRPIDVSDMLGVAMNAAGTSLTSGRTISGLTGSLSEFGQFSPIKAASSTISAWTPTLPGLQELGRLFGGTVVDSKMAGLWDYLSPMPTSKTQVNMLGDKVGSGNDLQR
ncbi:MAG TPA: hypothetical protein VNM37_09185, partial [Candidatus Dormibacteraeota bacterium]|nr:hypothetical protein [Candidatus Dormibacteraeota bacterium]